MQVIKGALAAIAAAEAQFHNLIDAPATIAGYVKDLAVATARFLGGVDARVVALENRIKQLEGLAIAIAEHPALASDIRVPDEIRSPPPADPGLPAVASDTAPTPTVEAVRAELEQVPTAPPVVPIPLSAEIKAAIDAQPSSTEPSLG